MSTLYLHIGWEKCGSSALQRRLSAQPVWATRSGQCIYTTVEQSGHLLKGEALTESARRAPEAYAVTAKSFPDKLRCLEDLKRELRRRSLVLSREGWCREAVRFKNSRLFAGLDADVVIVAYVRPQVDLLNSSWWQWWCYRKRFKTPADWIYRNGIDHFDYFKHLSEWRDVPGVTKVCARILSSDIATDFLAITGSSEEAQADAPADKRDNATLPLPVIRAVRNLLGSGRLPAGSVSPITFKLKDLWGNHGLKPWGITRETATALIEGLRTSNEKLMTMLDEESAHTMATDPRWWSTDAFGTKFELIDTLHQETVRDQRNTQTCLEQTLIHILTNEGYCTAETAAGELGNQENHAEQSESAARHLTRLAKYETSLSDHALQRECPLITEGHVSAPQSPPRFERFWQPQQYAILKTDTIYYTGGNFMTFTPDRRILADCSLPLHWQPLYLQHSQRHFDNIGAIPCAGSRILMLGSHKNYFHWMINWLSRASRLDAAGLLADVDAIMVGENAPPFVRDSLTACPSLASFPILSLSDNSAVCVTNSLLCPITPYPQYCPQHLSWLRKTFLTTPAERNDPVKLFISRKDADSRRLTNYDEVVQILTDFGYQEIDPANLSVTEQAGLFHRASHVAAVHGSALTNLLFCKPGTQVIEFQSRERFFKLYPALGWFVGARYRILKGEPEGDLKPNHRHIHISPDELHAALASQHAANS